LPKNKAKIDKRWWFVAACALIGTVLINELPNFHAEKYLGVGYSWQLDVVIHAGYFFALTVLFRFAVFKKTIIFLFFSILFFFSLILELLQAWIPKRSATVLDMFSNAIGIGLAIAVCLLIEKIRGNRKLLLEQE
jgi:glycopeptide antibiotics resistance protein